MKHVSLSLALLAASVLPTSAHAALDATTVSADARWVVHVDFNALRDSALGKELIAHTEKAQREATKGVIGLDVPKVLATIGSATAYGANFSKDPHAIDGALVVRGTPDLRKIIEGLLLQTSLTHPKNVAEIEDLPFPAYSLTDGKQDGKNAVVIAFPPEPIVLVSKSKTQLLKARDVVRGAAPSLAKAPSSPLQKLVRPSRDAYLFCASTVPSEEIFAEDGPQARILKMAQSSSIALGESGGNTFAHAELIATSEPMADKLVKILQGMTAMLSLAETSDRQLAEFINSTSVSREGETVTLHLAYSSARLIEMVKALQQNHAPASHANHDRPQITNGRVLAEWTAENVGDEPSAAAVRTIENVTLQNGSTITLGRALNGGRAVRFTQVEIVPAAGGAPLVFRREMMRNNGNFSSFPFPGADGTYTLKASYINDGSGKTTYAVSVRDPKPAAETAK